VTQGDKKMFLQRLLARWDKFISNLLQLSRDTTSGGEGTSSISSFYGLLGSRMAIIDTNGEIRILTGLYTIHHLYYDGQGKLLKRVSVRKDLKKGEHLATQEEIGLYREKLRKQFSENFSGMMNF